MKNTAQEIIFIVGIGGSGMSTLARLLNASGHRVIGSDREFDRGQRKAFYRYLKELGIHLVPQDGSGIDAHITRVVASTAVESHIPDIQAARRLNIPVEHRARELARQMTRYTSIAVAGTSGKTTVTNMLAWIFLRAGKSPTILAGAPLAREKETNVYDDFIAGSGKYAVFEADESDGSLVEYHPTFGLINNISKDHKPLEVLRPIFRRFAENIKETLVYNADCPETRTLFASQTNAIAFGINAPAHFRAEGVTLDDWHVSFHVESITVKIPMPGFHNAMNALAAYTIARVAGLQGHRIAGYLADFPGVHRRFQKIGETRGVTVVDDYAHNPDKIAASLRTARQLGARIIAIYQPHGFGPTRFLKDELVTVFVKMLTPSDILVFLPIYFAGGTVKKTIHSETLAGEIMNSGIPATVLEKPDIPDFIHSKAKPGDIVLVMGARDTSLPEFTRSIWQRLRSRTTVH